MVQNRLKTTLTLHAIAEAQKQVELQLYWCRTRFDRNYAKKLGVDIENLIISQPDNGEQALEIAENLILWSNWYRCNWPGCGFNTKKSEIEGEMGILKWVFMLV
jgi:recombination protein RecA